MAKVNPIPEGYHTVTPYLVVNGAADAIEFYKKAFGAEEVVRMAGPGDAVMHAEIRIGDSNVMLSEEFPGQQGIGSPRTIGGTSVNLHLYVEDTDSAYERALRAGATSVMAPQDMFWGDRYCKLLDPFGHSWALATHQEDVTPEEMEKRAAEFMAQMEKGG